MNNISTKYIMYQNVPTMHNTHVHQPCEKIQHPWNVSTICLYQHVNMCIYQYANHVHPPICQPCVISLMICLHHEPSTITMYQTNTNCCVNKVIPIKHIPYMSVPNITMHQYQKMMNPIFVCQILHKTCVNQTTSRCLY